MASVPTPGPDPGGSGTGSSTDDPRDDHGDGSGTTEENIPPDAPPDVEAAMLAVIDLTVTIKGAFMNLYEACKKIPRGDELATVIQIAQRKMGEMGDQLFETQRTMNVKSNNRVLTGPRADTGPTGAQNNAYNLLVAAGIFSANNTT